MNNFRRIVVERVVADYSSESLDKAQADYLARKREAEMLYGKLALAEIALESAEERLNYEVDEILAEELINREEKRREETK